jgi:hypothetical protein
VAVAPGNTVEPVPADVAKEVVQAVNTLTTTPPEPLSAAQQAAAKDPGKLVGRWNILKTIAVTNGTASEPSEPLMPTAWVITADGHLQVDGGMQISATYVYTGDKLVISGMGPVLEYRVTKLTDTDLEVVDHMDVSESLVFDNTTVFRRATK